MRILVVNPYDLTYPGGVTSHVLDLAHQFHCMGHDVTVAGPAGDGMLPQNGYTHHLGGTHTVLSPGDSARINLSPTVIPAIKNFLQGRKFDVVHLHEPYLPFIGPAFLHMTDAVKVGTFHTWREGPHLPYIIGWPFLRYWNTKLNGRIAVSHLAEKTIHAYVPAKYRIIPNGVDFSRFACPAPPPEQYADERPTLLFVGRIEARKGIPFLLSAYKIVKQAIPSSRLVLVGDGGLRAQYTKEAAEMGLKDVHFEGFVDPELLPAYYQRGDVFCSPSTVNESFGITLLEAMSAGTPCVATSTNFVTLGEHEVHGLMVSPKDPGAMAAAAIRLLEDRALAENLSAKAHERARQFDWAQVASDLVDYYRELGA